MRRRNQHRTLGRRRQQPFTRLQRNLRQRTARLVAIARVSTPAIRQHNLSNTKHNSKVVLIGGSSHVGKSTVSESLAAELGWTHHSTDSLARHPGRPWAPAHQKVTDNVADHYLNLSVDELVEDVLRHYRVNVWPEVEAIVASHLNDPSMAGIVAEGSALWPEFTTSLDFNKVSAIWLTASEIVFRQRIYTESMYSSKSSRERMMIDKFLERTLAYNKRMVDAVNRLGFTLVDVRHSNVTELTERCLSILRIDKL